VRTSTHPIRNRPRSGRVIVFRFVFRIDGRTPRRRTRLPVRADHLASLICRIPEKPRGAASIPAVSQPYHAFPAPDGSRGFTKVHQPGRFRIREDNAGVCRTPEDTAPTRFGTVRPPVQIPGPRPSVLLKTRRSGTFSAAAPGPKQWRLKRASLVTRRRFRVFSTSELPF
jgi:hypothetical protein